MTLILSGTDGLSDVDGTAATPALRGTDANTGIFFPAADTIAFAEGGAEVARFDSSGNLGIGTSSPLTKLHLQDNAAVFIQMTDSADGASRIGQNGTALTFGVDGSNGTTERARIDSSGNLLVGRTTAGTSNAGGFSVFSTGLVTSERNGTVFLANRFGSDGTAIELRKQDATVGSISVTASATAYNTSSDYRLKNTIAPMTGALAKVALLKPVTYKWNLDGSDGQGFIAHELQEVVEGCVTGEKDAVDADGEPVHQGIDTSFLVATLTAAIQEQQALITQLQADVALLKGTTP